MNELDRALFLALNGTPSSSGALILVALVLAKYLVFIVPMHMALVWVGGDRSLRSIVLTGALALVSALAINQLIGVVAYRPRPFLIGLGHALVDHRASSSLPSNHATVFFAYAAALYLLSYRQLGLAFASIGLLVAWSRIFLGIHYPLDMAAAALTSGLAAFVATRFMARHGARAINMAEAAWAGLLERAPAAAQSLRLR